MAEISDAELLELEREYEELRKKEEEEEKLQQQQQGDVGEKQDGRRGGEEGEEKSRKRRESGAGEEGEKKERKKRSRWGNEEVKTTIPGMPTILPSTLSSEQQEIYIIYLRLEEIARKLRSGDVIPPDNERSPSPEPTYDGQGNRTNTRDKRYRKKLEEERNKLIELAMKKNPEFQPPPDYKKPTKCKEKVFIPQKEYPTVNFIGQLLGPRGNTLKKMETDAGGAKIFIRGKGSIKEGKAPKDGGPIPGEDEELHCLVTGDTEEIVSKAVKSINEIIELGKSVPEGQNERKKLQLRELAALNGTLREEENLTCRNCGAPGHHYRDCTEKKNVTQTIFCSLCGGAGHLRNDCRMASNPLLREHNQAMDQEYLSLMKELGEEIPNQPGSGQPNPQGNPNFFPNKTYVRPPIPMPQTWPMGQVPFPGAQWPGATPWSQPQASYNQTLHPGAPGTNNMPPPPGSSNIPPPPGSNIPPPPGSNIPPPPGSNIPPPPGLGGQNPPGPFNPQLPNMPPPGVYTPGFPQGWDPYAQYGQFNPYQYGWQQ